MSVAGNAFGAGVQTVVANRALVDRTAPLWTAFSLVEVACSARCARCQIFFALCAVVHLAARKGRVICARVCARNAACASLEIIRTSPTVFRSTAIGVIVIYRISLTCTSIANTRTCIATRVAIRPGATFLRVHSLVTNTLSTRRTCWIAGFATWSLAAIALLWRSLISIGCAIYTSAQLIIAIYTISFVFSTGCLKRRDEKKKGKNKFVHYN